MKAGVAAYMTIRLDDRDPWEQYPESADDYQERYRAFWLRFEAWLRVEGIVPSIWPSVVQWWFVSFGCFYPIDQVPRVVEYLEREGITVSKD